MRLLHIDIHFRELYAISGKSLRINLLKYTFPDYNLRLFSYCVSFSAKICENEKKARVFSSFAKHKISETKIPLIRICHKPISKNPVREKEVFIISFHLSRMPENKLEKERWEPRMVPSLSQSFHKIGLWPSSHYRGSILNDINITITEHILYDSRRQCQYITITWAINLFAPNRLLGCNT